MDYAKGGRFFVIDEKAKKAEPPDISGKLNPKQVEEDEVFTNNDNGDALPF